MRKVKFWPHPVANKPAETLAADVEPDGEGMDLRLPLIGAALFAAVVAAGGWNFHGGSAALVTDPSPLGLTATSTAVTSQAGTARTPTARAATGTPSPSFAIPSPVPGRERERDDSGRGAIGTPGTQPRERDDD